MSKIDQDNISFEYWTRIYSKKNICNAEDLIKLVSCDIMLYDEETYIETKIGSFMYRIIPTFEQYSNLYESLISIDQVSEDICFKLFEEKKGDYCLRNKYRTIEDYGVVIYFEEIEILKEYRGNGIAKLAFQTIDDLIKYPVVLKAYPTQFNPSERENLCNENNDFFNSLTKIIKAYKKCGFKEMGEDLLIKLPK